MHIEIFVLLVLPKVFRKYAEKHLEQSG